MIAEDRMEKERIDCKNALEEYVYNTREKLEGELSEFVQPAVKNELLQTLSSLENWLYEEGSDEKKHVYNDRLDLLKVSVDVFYD